MSYNHAREQFDPLVPLGHEAVQNVGRADCSTYKDDGNQLGIQNLNVDNTALSDFLDSLKFRT